MGHQTFQNKSPEGKEKTETFQPDPI